MPGALNFRSTDDGLRFSGSLVMSQKWASDHFEFVEDFNALAEASGASGGNFVIRGAVGTVSGAATGPSTANGNDKMPSGSLVSFDTSMEDQFDFADLTLEYLSIQSDIDAEESFVRLISTGEVDTSNGLIFFELVDQDGEVLGSNGRLFLAGPARVTFSEPEPVPEPEPMAELELI